MYIYSVYVNGMAKYTMHANNPKNKISMLEDESLQNPRRNDLFL